MNREYNIPYFDQPDAKEIELSALRKENEELKSALKNMLNVYIKSHDENESVQLSIGETLAILENTKQLLNK